MPATHVQDVAIRTTLAKNGSAELHVAVAVNREPAVIRGRLVAPDGETVNEFELKQQASGRHEAVVRVAKPQLWTAETPALYRLQL